MARATCTNTAQRRTDGQGRCQEPKNGALNPNAHMQKEVDHGRGPKVTPSLVAFEALRLLAHYGWGECRDTHEAQAGQEISDN